MRASTTRQLLVSFVAGLATLVGATSCSSGEATSSTPGGGSSVSGAILVSAAASLTESFTTIKDDFIAANPEAEVTINFGSSGQLSRQIEAGAPADVAAFANTLTMTSLEEAGLLAGPPTTFAINRLAIVTADGNPTNIESIADLASSGIISLCSDTAPCGSFTEQALTDAGVRIPQERVTRGQGVKATLTAVTEGDADAAIVYLTDAAAAGDAVDVIEIPEQQNVIAEYPIAVIADSANTTLADTFRTYVLSERGQAVLREAGFLAP